MGSSLSSNSVSHALSSSKVIGHMFSRSQVFEFSDPQSESFFTTIKDRVSRQAAGLTESEKGEVTRLSAELTTSVTNVVSTSNSNKCDSTVLIKTLVTPILNYRSRLAVTMVNGW